MHIYYHIYDTCACFINPRIKNEKKIISMLVPSGTHSGNIPSGTLSGNVFYTAVPISLIIIIKKIIIIIIIISSSSSSSSSS